jgi:mannose-1-phosphate guanylyltransferase
MGLNGFLLAAGRGTRLRELTAHTAKPALPVAGLPMLAYSMNLFFQAGVRRLAVNTHHCPKTITDILDRIDQPWELMVSHEDVLLDTGGGIKRCEAFLKEAPVIIANGDVVCDVDIRSVVAFHRDRQAALTLVAVSYLDANTLAPVAIDSDNYITDINRTFSNKSTGDHLYAGIAIFEPQMFQYLKAISSSVVYTGYTGLIGAGERVCAYVHEGRWYDCGTPESYAEVNVEIASNASYWKSILHPHLWALRMH